ncbi:MAG: biotin--[acetyl-CoA-carboxylase] ligase, partial [Pedobacter sp.]
LFVGQNLIKLSSVDSTNNFLKTMLSNSEPLAEGTVIMADEQFAGRGQRDSVWHTETGKNLTISLLLKPTFLSLDRQFLLNMCVSIALNKALSKFVPNGISIKWPNDIYYKNQKIGGVLIENKIAGSSIKTAVIGIGININQQYFPVNLENTATSLHRILQEDVNLQHVLAEICSHIEYSYLKLKEEDYIDLRENYVSKLYKLNEKSLYRQNGEIFEGTIIGVSDIGMLRLQRGNEITEYNFKEIEFINTK